MATALEFNMRCQSKNLIASMDPTGDHSMSVVLQTVPPPAGLQPVMQQFSTLNATIAAADDTFLIGRMYKVTVMEELK